MVSTFYIRGVLFGFTLWKRRNDFVVVNRTWIWDYELHHPRICHFTHLVEHFFAVAERKFSRYGRAVIFQNPQMLKFFTAFACNLGKCNLLK